MRFKSFSFKVFIVFQNLMFNIGKHYSSFIQLLVNKVSFSFCLLNELIIFDWLDFNSFKVFAIFSSFWSIITKKKNTLIYVGRYIQKVANKYYSNVVQYKE